MTVYIVYHDYDVDGGYGDAVPRKDVIGAFLNEEEAKAFVKRYSHPIVYDKPYDSLECGHLCYEPLTAYDTAAEAPEFDIVFHPEDIFMRACYFYVVEPYGYTPRNMADKENWLSYRNFQKSVYEDGEE